MKILVMSDEESVLIWDKYKPALLTEADLVISAGDLKPEYLSYAVTYAHGPVLYVHGNHDERYDTKPPEGCECIEDQIYVHNGIRILGLGGSMRYRVGTHQYKEKEMERRIRRLTLKLKRYGGFDILVTHAPMANFHDDPKDLCHTGFEVFRGLLEKYRPKYFVHGHMHMNYGLRTPRLSLYQPSETVVINAHEFYSFEYDDPTVREKAARITD